METAIHKPVKPIDSKFVALGGSQKKTGPLREFGLFIMGNRYFNVKTSIQIAENSEKAADKHLEAGEYMIAIRQYEMALECLRDAANTISPCMGKNKAPTMHKRIMAKMETVTAKIDGAIIKTTNGA